MTFCVIVARINCWRIDCGRIAQNPPPHQEHTSICRALWGIGAQNAEKFRCIKLCNTKSLEISGFKAMKHEMLDV